MGRDRSRFSLGRVRESRPRNESLTTARPSPRLASFPCGATTRLERDDDDASTSDRVGDARRETRGARAIDRASDAARRGEARRIAPIETGERGRAREAVVVDAREREARE